MNTLKVMCRKIPEDDDAKLFIKEHSLSIKPIDIQVNVGHSLEVAKNLVNRNDAVLHQQTTLDSEAVRLSNSKNKMVFEAEKDEEANHLDDDEHNRRQKEKDVHNKKILKPKRYDNIKIVENENIGGNIDIKQ